MVTLKYDAADLVLLAFVDFVDQKNLVGLALKISFDLSVKVAFFLEVIDEVLLTFLNQIAIDRSLGIDGDQFFDRAPGDEWQRGKSRSGDPYRDQRTNFHFKRHIHAIGLRVILRRI